MHEAISNHMREESDDDASESDAGGRLGPPRPMPPLPKLGSPLSSPALSLSQGLPSIQPLGGLPNLRSMRITETLLLDREEGCNRTNPSLYDETNC